MSNISSKILLEKLKQDASPKVQETLETIFSICEEQLKQGLYDFSVATVSRIGRNKGVPKAQSIRNKSGEKYRALLDCFAQNNVNKTKTNKKENWIDEIESPKHRLLVQMLASELASTKQKLNEIIPPGTVINVYDHNESIDEFTKFTPIERRALEYILSDSFKKKWYLSESENGAFIDESKKAVFKPATVDALKKAMRYL
jgi:hypothetical protein